MENEKDPSKNVPEQPQAGSPIGSHTVDLAHRDMMIFDSTHELEVPNQLTFVRIYSKVTSNGLEITERPEDFESEFSAAY